ncbi:LOW QUALITY PROTEIN: reverse transcriptase [Phytophthora megakarya]|uniref:Reverse transcriptase n=1 Tax=Phytophthora megakarya TaxID=4795 RepID=A0A225V0T8_9STRA|nr:LOW QUALITY PROTEIN: reverse transcriptase [Phytophthora megakarya]
MGDATQIEAEFPDPGRGRPSTPTTSPDADRYLRGDAEGGGITCRTRPPIGLAPRISSQTQIQLDQAQIKLDLGEEPDAKPPICPNEGVGQRDLPAEGATATTPPDAEDEDGIYYHESVISQLKVSKETWPSSPKSRSRRPRRSASRIFRFTPEEIERLRQIIWKKRHLLIGKGNALPPAAKGVVCDIDVGNAKPIALRTRKVPTRFRENVAGLIKGLLAAEIIRPSTSPWASPIVIVRKSNGVDIRLCIDYKLMNSLTRLMVYPMPLISDLLEDLDKALWYGSLDMASGFWVVPMTDQAREISAFITPFGLFEWSRMPFGLKNARRFINAS